MNVSIGNSFGFAKTAQTDQNYKTSKLQKELQTKLSSNIEDASQEEMLEACKSFETYLVQQVMKQVKNSVAKNEEEEGEYVAYFGDMLYEKYAEDITESGKLGIAQQLFEAMKRNG